MFLKNDSNFQCGLRTKKEVLTIKPKEVVHVLDVDILTINSKLVKVSEKEYDEYLKSLKTEQIVTQPIKEDSKESVKEEDQAQVNEIKADSETNKKDEQEENKEAGEQQEDQTQAETLEALEAKLEELKNKWQQTTRPNKKEAIHKEIKEVQDKINKLQ